MFRPILSLNILLTPPPPSLRRPTLIRQFPQDYPASHLMPHILHPTTRCSILWPFPPILHIPTSMRTYNPVSPLCTLHSRLIQTHTPPQGLRPPPLLHRGLGVNLILNSSIPRYHPLHNPNMPNSHPTINNSNPQLLLTWSSIIIINPLTKILILLSNTIRFNNNNNPLNNNNNTNNNNNSNHNNSNYPLLLEPPPSFQPLLIPVIHMPSMNLTGSP